MMNIVTDCYEIQAATYRHELCIRALKGSLQYTAWGCLKSIVHYIKRQPSFRATFPLKLCYF